MTRAGPFSTCSGSQSVGMRSCERTEKTPAELGSQGLEVPIGAGSVKIQYLSYSYNPSLPCSGIGVP